MGVRGARASGREGKRREEEEEMKKEGENREKRS